MILALLQVFAVILGASIVNASVSIALDSDYFCNKTTILIGRYGYFLLLVPLAWISGAFYLESRDELHWPRSFTMISGLLLLLIFAGVFYWAFSDSATVKGPPSAAFST